MAAEEQEKENRAEHPQYRGKPHADKPQNAQCNAGTVHWNQERRDGGNCNNNDQKRADNARIYSGIADNQAAYDPHRRTDRLRQPDACLPQNLNGYL
ncbi:hypothetical protein D3C73_943340 [compost metagenome]